MVDSILLDALDIDEKIRELAETQDDITVLDAGCGSGAAIEERVRRLQASLRLHFRRKINLTGIGIDINPVPHLIHRYIASIDPEKGYAWEKKKIYPNVASVRPDDIVTLETVPSNSVDIVYSIAVLAYVADVLRAIEASWRVLKPGGIMCHQIPFYFTSKPDLADIISHTKGGSAFSPKYVYFNDYILATKTAESDFEGFPYRMTSVFDYYQSPEEGFAHREHIKVGMYEKIKD